MKKLFKLLSLPLFAVFATSEIEASSTHSSLTIGSRYYSWDYWRGRFNYCSRFYLLQRNKRSNNYIYLKKLRLCLYLIYQVESYEFKCFFFINPFFKHYAVGGRLRHHRSRSHNSRPLRRAAIKANVGLERSLRALGVTPRDQWAERAQSSIPPPVTVHSHAPWSRHARSRPRAVSLPVLHARSGGLVEL